MRATHLEYRHICGPVVRDVRAAWKNLRHEADRILRLLREVGDLHLGVCMAVCRCLPLKVAKQGLLVVKGFSSPRPPAPPLDPLIWSSASTHARTTPAYPSHPQCASQLHLCVPCERQVCLLFVIAFSPSPCPSTQSPLPPLPSTPPLAPSHR